MARYGLLVVLCLALAAVTYAEEDEKYTDKYDYIDVVATLKNERLRNQYFACFMETAPCLTPDAKFFKEKFPEALVTKCRKCTEKQKDGFEKIFLYYSENEPEKWTKVVTKSIKDAALRRHV